MAAAGLETSLYPIGRPEVKYATYKSTSTSCYIAARIRLSSCYIAARIRANILLYRRSDQG